MAISCTPASLEASAKAFRGLSKAEHDAVQTYLLAVIAGGSTDPATLQAAAKSFDGLSQKELLQVQNYLLCSIVNA